MKRNWQNHEAQALVECSIDECNEQITIDGYPDYAVRRGWAIHNGEWICPTHLAVIDEPKRSAPIHDTLRTKSNSIDDPELVEGKE